jgi:hypothetical protein
MILILLNSRDCSNVFNMLDSEGLYVSQAVGGVEVSHDNLDAVLTMLELGCIPHSLND